MVATVNDAQNPHRVADDGRRSPVRDGRDTVVLSYVSASWDDHLMTSKGGRFRSVYYFAHKIVIRLCPEGHNLVKTFFRCVFFKNFWEKEKFKWSGNEGVCVWT